MVNKEKLEEFYFKNYRLLMIIPIILLLISAAFLGIKYIQTGEIIKKDISLKGGVTATVYTDKQIDTESLKKAITAESNIRVLTDFVTGKQIGFIVETSDISSEDLKLAIEKNTGLTLTNENYSVEETTAKLGASFFKQLMIAIIIAFCLMAVSVFVAFRTFAPSMAVVFAALADLLITLGILSIFNFSISSAGIVAFLLVIGYSVDTDMLLTTRCIKRKEPRLFERMISSVKTGLTMTFTTIIALTAGLILTNSVVIKEMFTIIIIALFIDIITTYLTNAGILVWYCKRKGIT